jgi:hypothetical protein
MDALRSRDMPANFLAVAIEMAEAKAVGETDDRPSMIHPNRSPVLMIG